MSETQNGASAPEPGAMTLIEHLTELRHRLIRAGQAIIVGVGLALYFAADLLNIIRAPVIEHLPEKALIFTGVMDKFMAHIKVGVLGGVILSCPFWLYQLWLFISPGLYKHERRYVAGFILSGTILFMVGVGFVYFLVFPAAFEFLFKIGGETDRAMITLDSYLSFFVITTIVFGLSFELPVVLCVLAMMGIVDSAFLRKYRRYAIVGLAVITAIVTPPDAISMLMMLIPMVLLYESSIWVIHFFIQPRSNPQAPEL